MFALRTAVGIGLLFASLPALAAPPETPPPTPAPAPKPVPAKPKEKPVAEAAPALPAGQQIPLHEALRLAKMNNTTVTRAHADTEVAEAQASSAIYGYIPTVNGSLGASLAYTKDNVPLRDQFVDVDYTTGTLSANGALRWTLWDFGRHTNVKSANATERAAKASERQVTNELYRDVGGLFYRLVADQLLVEAGRLTLAQREKHAQLAKTLARSGIVPPVEEYRGQIVYQQAQVELLNIETRLAVDRSRLAVRLGLDPSANIVAVAPSNLDVDADLQRVDAVAQRSNPRVLAATALAKARDNDTWVARSRFFPQLQFQGDASYRNLSRDAFDNLRPYTFVQGALVLAFPIFDLNVYQRVRVADAQFAAANALMIETTRNVRSEALEAALNVKSTTAIAETLHKIAETSTAVLATIQVRYQSGLATPLELLSAEETDVRARYDSINADAAAAMAKLELMTIMGSTSAIEGHQ